MVGLIAAGCRRATRKLPRFPPTRLEVLGQLWSDSARYTFGAGNSWLADRFRYWDLEQRYAEVHPGGASKGQRHPGVYAATAPLSGVFTIFLIAWDCLINGPGVNQVGRSPFRAALGTPLTRTAHKGAVHGIRFASYDHKKSA
jgi:hypothetical protein